MGPLWNLWGAVGPYRIYGVTWGSPGCLSPLWDLWGELGPYGIYGVTWGSPRHLGPYGIHGVMWVPMVSMG